MRLACLPFSSTSFSIPQYILRRCLRKIYKKYHNQGWSVHCHAPHFLNLFMPDFSAQYYIATFRCLDDIQIRAHDLPMMRYKYVSITVYDEDGDIVDVLNDLKWASGGSDFILQKPTRGKYFCVVLRIYGNRSKIVLPRISINHQLVHPLYISTQNQNAHEIEASYSRFIRYRPKKKLSVTSTSFFVPTPSSKKGLFCNYDACYMVASMPLSGNAVIYGKKPPMTTCRFVGFMACDYQTTKTDSCISDEDLPSTYRIWVSYSRESAISQGYSSKHYDGLLCFTPSNQEPIVVYRMIHLDHESSFHNIMSNTPYEAQKAFRDYYPILVSVI